MCVKDHDNDRSLERGLSHQEHLYESGPLDGRKLVWVIMLSSYQLPLLSADCVSSHWMNGILFSCHNNHGELDTITCTFTDQEGSPKIT